MILSPVVHTSKHVIALISDIVRCHTDMVQTVNGLKIQVAVMNTKNRHLKERVRVLEENAEKKCVADAKQHEDNQLVFTNTVTSLESRNKALTGGVGFLERITEELRIAYEKRAEEKRAEEKRAEEKLAEEKRAKEKRAAELVALQKRTVDRFGELKRSSPFPLHEAARVSDSPEVLDYFLLIH